MTTLADEDEIHPNAFVTVNVYVPAANPDTVALVPEPVVVVPPGERVKVQVPLDGKPVNITLPVARIQVG